MTSIHPFKYNPWWGWSSPPGLCAPYPATRTPGCAPRRQIGCRGLCRSGSLPPASSLIRLSRLNSLLSSGSPWAPTACFEEPSTSWRTIGQSGPARLPSSASSPSLCRGSFRSFPCLTCPSPPSSTPSSALASRFRRPWAAAGSFLPVCNWELSFCVRSCPAKFARTKGPWGFYLSICVGARPYRTS